MKMKQYALALLRICTSLSFVGVGCSHFSHTNIFVQIMPSFLPFHEALVLISGFFEILGGIGLLVPQWRRWAAWGLLALLVAVFPANIHMAINEIYLDVEIPQHRLGLWLRLPFQLVIALQVWAVGLWNPK